RDLLFPGLSLPEQAQGLSQAPERPGRVRERLAIPVARAVRFGHAIDRLREVEEMALRLGGVEIVLHRFFEELLGPERLAVKTLRLQGLGGGVSASRLLSGLERRAQPAVGDPRLAQPLRVPLDRAPVVRALQ